MNTSYTKPNNTCTRCGAIKYNIRDPWCVKCNAKCFNCASEKPKYYIPAYGIRLCGKCHAGEDS